MSYKEFIGVNENFQYSVNLQFDLNNISKIKEYIPTKDACEILKMYLESILNGKNRATTLIGPYGKGKSHLLLVLLTLINNYDKSSETIFNLFLDKINKVDKELYELIIDLRKKQIRLMPVVINSNYGDLNQAFLLGLSEALERENLNDVVINTYFDIALNVIDKWENEYYDAINNFKECLKEYNITLKGLKVGLKDYSEKSYEIFKNVYSCILHGQEFNPLVNSDVVKIYKDLAHSISKYKYNGIFIAFDEFSKFLEYVDNSHMMKDLKLLQDFAELSNRTGTDEQIHLCCITHKAMNNYSKDLSDDKINAFKTVEGRFKEIYFNRSIEQNYEIVSYALEKKKGFDEYFTNYFENNAKYYLEVKDNRCFKDTSLIEEILFKGCFPLNPFTVYSLIQLSEKIAQNERTLFTFLTDDDPNSLKKYIENYNEQLFNVDKIYDYFKVIMKKETDSGIKSYWIKSENSLNKTQNIDEKKIIKCLAIIYMINDLETLIPDDETIRLSLNLSKTDFENALSNLIDKSILKRKKITNEIDFSTIYNRELSKEIKKLSETQFYEIDIKNSINKIITKNYSLPRRYNERFKMTRFFSNVYMNENELMAISDFNILFDNEYCDGIIINLIRDSRNINEIREHIGLLSNDRVVVKVPKVLFPKQIITLLRDYKSIEYLLETNSSEEIENELKLMKKEIVEALEELIEQYFSTENIQEYIYLNDSKKKINNISSFISDICFEVYDKTPIINNEMINKRELSAPIKKARDIVINTVLSNDNDLIKSETSAEATIYKAIVSKSEESSISNILDLINKFISKSDNNKISFSKLYDILENKPYSVRKGVIPILLSMALYNYSDIIILYYMNKEIDIDANNLIKLNDNPEKYFILTEKGTTDKIKYLSNLMQLFGVPNIDTQRVNIKKLIDSMRKWILSLPRVLRECNETVEELNITKEFINIKNEILKPDINNNEFIYSTVFEIYNTNDYKVILDNITSMKEIFDNFMSLYLSKLVDKTKLIFDSNFKGSLSSLLRDLYSKYELNKSFAIYDQKTKSFIDYISNLTTHDDNDIIEQISKITTGYYVEDWQDISDELIVSELENILYNINNKKEVDLNSYKKILIDNGENKIEKYLSKEDIISPIGNTLKNNLEDVIQEYGDSLSEEEKINILLSIINKYM